MLPHDGRYPHWAVGEVIARPCVATESLQMHQLQAVRRRAYHRGDGPAQRTRSRPPSSWSSTPRPTGSAGDACELTEVGAVLVGGGELHDRWSSLVRTSAPLRRGIQRFTGITQEMVDGAPSLESVLRPLARCCAGRVMVAHNAPFDRRVLRQAFERVGSRMAQSAGDLHRFAGPDDAAAAARAGADGARRRTRDRGQPAHRALADAETCARVLCALFPRLCAQRLDGRRRARRCCAPPAPPARRHRPPRGAPGAAAAGCRARLRAAAARPGRVPVSRRRRAGALRRQVSLDPQPRAGAFRALVAARRVDGARRGRRLPDHALRARRAGAREPADQGAGAARQQAPDPQRRPARLHPLPARHPVSDPRGRPRSGAPATRSRSARCEAGGSRSSWSSSSTRCSACATAGAGCRGANTRPPTGRWGAACRRASATWTPTSTAAGSTTCCACSSAPATAAAGRCSSTSSARCVPPRPSSASSALRPCAAGAGGWARPRAARRRARGDPCPAAPVARCPPERGDRL